MRFVMIQLSYEWGSMCNLAYIGATVLNFGLAWLADVCVAKHKQKFKNMAPI